jgi:crossover junction endodeoxyribonuclease RusA
MNFTITLPWPARELSPNARVHRMERARHVAAARQAAHLAALDIIGGTVPVFVGSLSCEIFFHPPSRGRHDLDNLFASMKPALDGICQALQIDDARIDSATILRGGVEKPGRVVIDIFDRW